METYANILMVASPIFFIFVMAEKLYGYYFKNDSFKSMDIISSLSSGFTNALKDVLGLSVSLITYQWLESRVAFLDIPFTWLNVFIAFMALDFAGYWGHRLNHYNNFFWNQHIIHHSSEEFNLACALRQSISNFVNFFTIFLIPAAILGVDFQIIAIIAPIHLFAQFWYHTIYIGKMGFWENIIVTPSHHRVHHAINPVYIDKNHGQIFIFWDRLFGTFQEELATEPPVYGITVPVRTWNPIKINFQHIWQMILDTFRTQTWADKLKIWYGKTGFRPNDVIERYPIFKIDEPHNYKKYYPQISSFLAYWSWVHFSLTFGFLMHFYSIFGEANFSSLLYYGLFIMACIYCFTELMDRNPMTFWYEAVKNSFGIYLYFGYSNWFNIPYSLNFFVLTYFVVSTLLSFYFCKVEFKGHIAAVNN